MNGPSNQRVSISSRARFYKKHQVTARVRITGNSEIESETMKALVSSNEKSRAFREYSDLLYDEILAHLNDSFEMAKEEALTHPGGTGHRFDHSN